MEEKKETPKRREKPEVYNIKIIWLNPHDKEWEELENDGDVAQIEYGTPDSKIYLLRGMANAPDIAHEFGHFIQLWCEKEKGLRFLHDEEVSFAFEEVMREILRRHLYQEYGRHKANTPLINGI